MGARLFTPPRCEDDFNDVRRLGGTRAHDVVTGNEIAIEAFDLFVAGSSCKDMSDQKSMSLGERGGMLRSGVGTSGETFHGVLSLVATHQPKAVMIENVANVLGIASDDGEDCLEVTVG